MGSFTALESCDWRIGHQLEQTSEQNIKFVSMSRQPAKLDEDESFLLNRLCKMSLLDYVTMTKFQQFSH